MPFLSPDIPIIAEPFKESDEHQKSVKITLFLPKTPIIVFINVVIRKQLTNASIIVFDIIKSCAAPAAVETLIII